MKYLKRNISVLLILSIIATMILSNNYVVQATDESCDEITKINLNGMLKATPGEIVGDYNKGIVPADGENYTIDEVIINEKDNNLTLSEDDMFISGRNYSVKVKLKANDGYEFADEAICNSFDETYVEYSKDDSFEATVTCYFNVDGVINEINVNGLKKANPGDVAGDYIKEIVPVDGENYTIDNVIIIDEENNSDLSEDEIFTAGRDYQVKMTLKANDGYKFASEVKVNSSDDIYIEYKYDGNDSTYATITGKFTVNGQISEININGLKKANPGDVVGDYIKEIVPVDGENYTIESINIFEDINISCLSEDDFFTSGKNYMVKMILKANDGYVFKNGVKANIPSGIYVECEDEIGDASYVTIMSKFTVNGQINEININGLNKANPGDVVGDYIKKIVPADGEKYTIDEVNVFDDNEYSYLSDDAIFTAGKKYKVYVELKANDGYSFTEDVEYKFPNGTYAECSVDYSLNHVTFRCDFIVNGLINEIKLSGAKKANPSDVVGDYIKGIVPVDGENYTVESVNVYDYTSNSNLSEDSILIAGRKYKVEVNLKANDGYAFSSEVEYNTSEEIFIDYEKNYSSANATIKYDFIVNGQINEIKLNGAKKASASDVVGDYIKGIVPVDGENYTVESVNVYDYTSNSNLSEDSIFIAGRKYKVTLYLNANKGYQFASAIDYTAFEGTDAEYQRDYSYANAALEYYFITDGLINEIKLNGAKKANPSDAVGDYIKEIVLVDGENYTIESINVYDNTSNSNLSEDSIFIAGRKYSVTLNLKANKGYEFARKAEYIAFEGTDAEYQRDYYSNVNATLKYYFIADGQVNNIGIKGLKKAKPGEIVSDYNAGIVPLEGENYTVESIQVYEKSTYSSLSDEEIFAPGKNYAIEVKLKAKDGYTFVNKATLSNIEGAYVEYYKNDDTHATLKCMINVPKKYALSNPVVAITHNSNRSVKLTWDPVENAKYYQLYKYYDSTGVIQKSKIVEGTEAYFYNLKEGSTYRYIVQAVGDYCESNNLSKDYVVDLRVGNPVSSVITDVSYKYSNNWLVLSWDKVDNADKYYVYKYFTSSKTLILSKEIDKTHCKYYIDSTNVNVKYLITTEKLENLSGYDGRGSICVRVCK